MSCHWQNEGFDDHIQQPVGCQQLNTPVSDQTTTDGPDRRSKVLADLVDSDREFQTVGVATANDQSAKEVVSGGRWS